MSREEDIPQPPQPPESFVSKKEAIQWMLDTNACRHKEAKTKKSDKTRAHFQCPQEGREFSCHITKNGDGLFRFAKWVWHSCGELAQPKVKRSWVVQKAKEKLGVVEDLQPKDLQAGLKTELGVDVRTRLLGRRRRRR